MRCARRQRGLHDATTGRARTQGAEPVGARGSRASSLLCQAVFRGPAGPLLRLTGPSLGLWWGRHSQDTRPHSTQPRPV